MTLNEAKKTMFLEYPDVVTTAQLAEMLGVGTENTARKMIQQYKLPFFRVGREYRIPKIVVIEFLVSLSSGETNIDGKGKNVV